MFQNLSKMSDIYIPELMELDSYWQRAVEDAICDTLKGEQRLCYALKNRKKINKKLKELGFGSPDEGSDFGRLSPKDPQDKELLESCSEQSESSAEEDTQNADLRFMRSWSKFDGDSPLEKRTKTPDRPLLGNGSLEKMKKSQNSFNFEPMGVDRNNNNKSFSENFDEAKEVSADRSQTSKKIQMIHVRGDEDFDKSDAENSDSELGTSSKVLETSDDGEAQKSGAVNDDNYHSNDKHNFRSFQSGKQNANGRTTRKAHSFQEQSEGGSEYRVHKNTDLEKRLQLALVKRDILNDNLKATSIGNSSTEVEINRAAARAAVKKRNSKQILSPFIKFYLEVYRELCHKCSMKQITEEAAKRWRNLSSKQKSAYTKRR